MRPVIEDIHAKLKRSTETKYEKNEQVMIEKYIAAAVQRVQGPNLNARLWRF